MPRPRDYACQNCQFSDPEASSDHKFLLCRYNAPTIPPDEDTPPWPYVGPLDWCGKFKPIDHHAKRERK